MKYICLICGVAHDETIKDDVLKAHLRQASNIIFANLKKRGEFQNMPSPMCGECGKEWMIFLKYEGPVLAAKFLGYIAMKGARSINVKEGLRKAKERGAKLGRPTTHTQDEINSVIQYRQMGMSYRQIELKTGLSTGFICNIIKNMNEAKAGDGDSAVAQTQSDLTRSDCVPSHPSIPQR